MCVCYKVVKVRIFDNKIGALKLTLATVAA